MKIKIVTAIAVFASCILSMAFIAIINAIFSINDEALKLTLVALLSSTNAIGIYKKLITKADKSVHDANVN